MFASHLDDANVNHQEHEGVVPQAPPTTIMIPSEPSSSPKNVFQVSPSSSHPDLHELVLPTQVTPVPNGVAAMEPSPTLFTNYDVLLVPSSSSPTSLHMDSDYTLIDHVGNRTFLVILNIYRQSFLEADEQDDEVECLRIVLEIIKTFRQQCQFKGRFLRLEPGVNGNLWFMIDDVPTLVRIIKDQLMNGPVKRAHTAEMSCQVVAKKTFPQELTKVDTPKPFDVICNSSWLLDTNSNHVGNNRLQVILDMRQKQFDEASTQEEKSKIVDEIVSVIIDDSASQFLSLHTSSGHYTPLSRGGAAMCVMNALGSKRFLEGNQLLSRHKKRRKMDGVVKRRNSKGHDPCSSYASVAV